MKLRVLAVCGAFVAALACGTDTIPLVSDEVPAPSQDADAGDSAADMDAASEGDAAVPLQDGGPLPVLDAGAREPVMCGGRPCACDNGQDDDGDGLADGLDPECTGAHDNDETSFATGLPGLREEGCLDCFWDRNGGFGDDGCRYPAECLQGPAPLAPGDPNCASCVVSDQCVDSCQSLTPNGCDCFGCCEVTLADGTQRDVLLRETCSLGALDDPALCPRCERHPDCRNDCGGCELCAGRMAGDLPASCGSGGALGEPVYRCDEGQRVCSAELPCAPGYYCQLGCCLPIPQ